MVLCCLLVLTGCSKQEGEWKNAAQKNTVAAFRQYLGLYPSGPHSADAHTRIEELEWQSAFFSRSKDQLESCIKNYPRSANVEKAKEVLWEIEWPPVKVDKANSITIFTGGIGVMRGTIIYSLSGFFGGGRAKPPQPAGPNRVFIWRTFAPEERDRAAKDGLRTGVAYLKTDRGQYKVIRKVDLQKSDAQLCAEFGVKK